MPIVTRALTFLETRAPRCAQYAKRWFVQYLVPFNRRIGLRIEKVAPDSSEVMLRLPYRRGNQNVGGTVHGAAIMALAETAHGVAVLWQFPPDRHAMFAKESRLEFLSPGRGELSVRFALEPGVRARIAAELDSGGRCLVELASVVTDCQGTEVARLDATYHIRRRAAEGPAPRGSTSGSGNG